MQLIKEYLTEEGLKSIVHKSTKTSAYSVLFTLITLIIILECEFVMFG